MGAGNSCVIKIGLGYLQDAHIEFPNIGAKREGYKTRFKDGKPTRSCFVVYTQVIAKTCLIVQLAYPVGA
jgi:hypothetical protein